MRNSQFDKSIEKRLLRSIDQMAKKDGVLNVKHACIKWANEQRTKARVEKRRRELEDELSKLSVR